MLPKENLQGVQNMCISSWKFKTVTDDIVIEYLLGNNEVKM